MLYGNYYQHTAYGINTELGDTLYPLSLSLSRSFFLSLSPLFLFVSLSVSLPIHYSVFLGNIKEAFDKNPNLQNLLLDEFFKKEIQKCQDSWRKVVAQAVTLGIPTPAFSTALAFFDGYRLILSHPLY